MENIYTPRKLMKLLWAKHWGSWASRTVKDCPCGIYIPLHKWPISMSVGWFQLLPNADHRWGWRITGGRRQFEGQNLELAALSVRIEAGSQQCGKVRGREKLERFLGAEALKGNWILRATEHSGGKCSDMADIIAWAQLCLLGGAAPSLSFSICTMWARPCIIIAWYSEPPIFLLDIGLSSQGWQIPQDSNKRQRLIP